MQLPTEERSIKRYLPSKPKLRRILDTKVEYALSLKLRKRRTVRQYELLMRLLQLNGVYVSDWCYELDKKRRLHVHSLVRCPIGLRFSKILNKDHIQYKFSLIISSYQKEGWLEYIYKDGYDDCESEHEPVPRVKMFEYRPTEEDHVCYQRWLDSKFNFPTHMNC